MTFKELTNLKVGDIIYHKSLRNADGSPARARVTGKVRRWKRNPGRVVVPCRHGLRNNFYIGTDVTCHPHWNFMTQESLTRDSTPLIRMKGPK